MCALVYAADCGADYIEIKDTEKITGRPWLDACWRNLTILQDMVGSPYSEILFLDCDIVIEDCAPDIFNNTLAKRFQIGLQYIIPGIITNSQNNESPLWQ